MIFFVTALICAASIARADCTSDSAVAVISLGQIPCPIAQSIVAQTAIKPGEGYYLHWTCEGR